MKNFILAISVMFLGIVCITSAAIAQDPDIREIRPAVMLLVDTSGSMNNYDISSRSGMSPPTCSGNVHGRNTKNRWTSLVEALTGSFSDYYCTSINRRTSYPGAADQYYYMPYFAPSGTQIPNGVLDAYKDRVKFGMMTMDPVYGIEGPGVSSLSYFMPESVYRAREADVLGALGEYSYGTARPLSFPGCGTMYLVNGGARRAALPGESIVGGLISVGADSTDYITANDQVQSTLLAIRPYGGSSLDALLEDFSEWIQTDSDVIVGSDPLAACREKYAILISDGEADDFYRRIGCDTPGYTCPYRRAIDTAADLCRWDGLKCAGALDGLFTVSYTVSDPLARASMDTIAAAGGTGSSYLADNTAALLSSLSIVLDRAALGTTTRTTAAFISSRSGLSALGQQYEFTSGFHVGHTGVPWSGVLERTRYTCTGPHTTPLREPISRADSFHEILNSRDLSVRPRMLITAVDTLASMSQGVLINNVDAINQIPVSPTRGATRATGIHLVPLSRDSTDVSPGHLGFTVGTTDEKILLKRQLIDWLQGFTRPTARLGDIYHSSPTLSSPPNMDIVDESFNMWRHKPEITDRPTMLYVGTNDGIMHAFSAEDYVTADSIEFHSGDELWGFVPSSVLPLLQTAAISHQSLVDGTPTIRNVFFRRLPGAIANADIYHTVLVAGLRGGGPEYFALDISDPLSPKFLWQFTRPEMGNAMGRPAIGQVLVEINGILQERAVAIFGGGSGIRELSGMGTGRAVCPSPVSSRITYGPHGSTGRISRRCWLNSKGRSLYIVDIASGEVIREFNSGTIGSPMTGGVSIFTGATGTVSTRAYSSDDDGMLWRIDMSSTQPDSWTMMPVHDLYWSDPSLAGSVSQEPPLLSIDNSGDVVVILGSGNMDNLEGSELYRVASVTDRTVMTGLGGISFTPVLNWEIRLHPGEQVTGPMELFASNVYFSTFSSTDNPVNRCEWGGSKVWGVSYIESGATPAGYFSELGAPFPKSGLESSSAPGVFDQYFTDTSSNTLAVGVTIGTAPTCIVGTVTSDPYTGGSRYNVTEAGGGEFRIVTQLSGSTASIPGSSEISTFSIELPMPTSFTQVLSSISQVD